MRTEALVRLRRKIVAAIAMGAEEIEFDLILKKFACHAENGFILRPGMIMCFVLSEESHQIWSVVLVVATDLGKRLKEH